MKLKSLIKILFLFLAVTIIYFLFRNIYTNWSQLKGYAVKINYLYVFLAYITFVITNIFMTGIWYILLRKLSAKINLLSSIAIWAVSTLGKYIPGKGWQFVGIVYLSKMLGVKYETSIAASLIGQILAVVAGLIISFSILKTHLPPVFVTFFIALSLLFIYPVFLNKLLKFLGRITGKKILEITLTTRDTILVTLLYFLAWLVFGVAFNFLTISILPASGFHIIDSAKIFVSSYLLGLFAIFVPGGLGIREGVMAYLLGKDIPSYLASFISVYARLVVTLAELSLTTFGIFYLKNKGISILRKSKGSDNGDRSM